MTESQILLSKIASLRQRLEQAHCLMRDADSAAAKLIKKGDANAALKRKAEAGIRQQSLLTTALQQLPELARTAGDTTVTPIQLTARAARLLHRAQDLLRQLRAMDEEVQKLADADPLGRLYRETVSMTDAVLRTAQAFPEAPSAQSRLSEGLETVLNIVAERLSKVNTIRQHRLRDAGRRDELAEILSALAAGRDIELEQLQPIAESVFEDAREGKPLRFPSVILTDISQSIASRGLAVAQVIARLTKNDTAWRAKPLEPIMAALMHDVGMLKVPAEILTHVGPLNDEQRRHIDRHPLYGAELAARIQPTSEWLIDAASQHHERIDGTGYPGGLHDMQIKPLVRLLAVCDAYAAMCQPRAYRPALDTRTALTDTLLMAEQGGLDKNCAERLLVLSFYPPGTVVEVSDGALGVVVATHQGRRELNLLARPVLALLTTAQGEMLSTPSHVDLAETEGRSVLRSLTADERLERLGSKYPELVSG